MDMEVVNQNKCKYCDDASGLGELEGLCCSECKQLVHLKCLRRGAVPGGFVGDIFFQFACQDCSLVGTETFIRDKMPWLQTILLALYHMQARSPGLARKGYFHWKIHIAAFIDKNWDILFRKDFKRKKKWTGTVSGTLSHYSPQFFKSGTAIFNEQGWWTLTYPTLSPNIIVQLNAELMAEKQKIKETKATPDDLQLLKTIILSKSYITEDIVKTTLAYMEPNSVPEVNNVVNNSLEPDNTPPEINNIKPAKPVVKKKKLPLLPTIDSLGRPKKIIEKDKVLSISKTNGFISKAKHSCKKLNGHNLKNNHIKDDKVDLDQSPVPKPIVKLPKFLDPLYYYNTSLKDVNRCRGLNMKVRLLGGNRNKPILSPYSFLYLKPYIKRSTAINTTWLQLMDELQVKANLNNPNWKLPPRGPIDFVYVQPEHIPAINSLCNQFFWTGIDVSDTLQYPDFSCVVLYRKLIIGFAFLIPDVKINESYLSFIFTRPGWRNSGIAKFMLYHLIQTSIGKDITLHVSQSNPALFLYQKFGFKVEYVVLDFYNRYMRDDTRESKHAYFCRLER
ncbi:hypothetical protein ILUMI_21820 [Ignelater luminosus]|uniref:N-acetyltransferase domain-containing protein n=1 Tax=Ignelater luminosus TaxID=2038154 RepID=A0A8K0G375_IGNLU|nr:hypothetical protein ILUMI_21820 [Ignelater luminosus]